MDFRTIFLDYFQKCLNEDSGIEIAALRDIASANNASVANAALKELMQEGIVASIPEVDADKINMPISECNKFKLTEKGIDFIRQRLAGYEQKNKFLYPDAYLSAYKKILASLPHEAIETAQAMSEMQDIVKSFQPALEQYKSILSSTTWNTINSAKALRDLQAHMPTFDASALNMRSCFTPEQIRQITDIYASIGDIVKSQYSGKNKKALSNFLYEVDKAQKEAIGSEEVRQIKTAAPGEENTKTFTFEGILGQNCGNVVESSSKDEKRIQVKGFKVNDGLRVLRGFAKSSDLAAISQADENYQRDKYHKHVVALSDFIQNIKTSAKYLPEVTLVSRGYEKLDRVTLSGKLSPTQQGELDNLEYFRLTVNKKQLYRVDGNHRLEALQDSDYYIPFAIIIWEESKVNQDDEAFLFYFLNAKAKRLTTEENLKGLLQATTWSDGELKEANLYIPHLKFLQKILDDPLLEHKFSKDDNPIKSIAELLEKLHADNEPIDLDCFKSTLINMGQLLIKDRWHILRDFNFYYQLMFYVAYKTKSLESAETFLENLTNWVEKYKFDNTTFDDPILLYNNAVKTNNLNPINIFVAMAYDEENIGNFTEWINSAIDRLDDKYAKYKDRLKLNPIMSKRGYALDLIDNIMNEIDQCGIFIAEISPCVIKDGDQDIKCDANPNVMYELGIAYNLRKPIILMREEVPFTKKVPSDIQEKYRIGYKRTNTQQSQQDIQDAIKNVLDNFFK